LESTQDLDIFSIVAIGAAAMTLLAGFIIFFVVLYQKKAIIQRNEVEAIKTQHQRDLLQKTIEVEEKERESIAKNIHDDLGALISILRLNNSRTAKNIDDKDILKKILESNKVILNKTSESVRSISKKLASPTLIKLGYVKAIKEICSSFNQTGEIVMHFNDLMTENFKPLPQKASQLFRASQEIINNIIKHAAASEINVTLSNDDMRTIIKFEHDGAGISETDVVDLIRQDKGLGLTSIQSRLSIVAAEIIYKARADINPSITITYFNDETKD
jgi:two-component system NarL family sensor kinase